jgi:hypothetical protein
MPDIMVRCPTLGMVVPTGLNTETVKFESLPNVEVPFRCPACRKMHTWRPITAWLARGRHRQHVRLVVQERG